MNRDTIHSFTPAICAQLRVNLSEVSAFPTCTDRPRRIEAVLVIGCICTTLTRSMAVMAEAEYLDALGDDTRWALDDGAREIGRETNTST